VIKGVILAGGIGQRLRPLTDSIPKALAPVHGVPMLRKQILALYDLGISDIVVLTGYRSDMVHSYIAGIFQNSNPQVTCIATPAHFSPAERIMASKSEIGDNFLLLYCDNLLNDSETIQKVIDSNSPLTFLVESRDEGNVSIESSVRYETSRSVSTPYVELGYIHVNTPKFYDELKECESLPHALAKITRAQNCKAFITTTKLESTSTIERFIGLRTSRRTVLLDRDGILNYKMPPRTYLTKMQEYIPQESVVSTLASKLSSQSDFIIITNQPGIATGEVTPEFLDKLHSRIIVELLLRGISVIGLYFCPHHWDTNCDCRKPKPGMMNQAILDYQLQPENLVYVGDEEKDLDAAAAAGIVGVRISNDLGKSSFRSLEKALPFIESILKR
jgi:histidinol-phosphate phosphatase family protein